jgi:uncharacterized protein (UPF0332 family)
MTAEFRRMVDERRLLRARVNRGLIVKEIQVAEADLNDARDSLKERKFKWATIQGYYSMFHAARALVYGQGFREKSHYALLVAIRSLLPEKIGASLIKDFEDAMSLREEADYGLTFSEDGASSSVEGAERFLKRAREILKI